MVSNWVSDLFYQMNQDYGTTISYTQIGKGDIDLDTGKRNDVKTALDIRAVIAPKSLYADFLVKVLGKVEYNKTMFLVLKADLPETFIPSTDDFISYNQKRYTQLEFNDLLSCYIISGIGANVGASYTVRNVSITDELRIDDA